MREFKPENAEEQLKKDLDTLIKKDYKLTLETIAPLLRFRHFKELWEAFLRDGGNPYTVGVITGYSFSDAQDAFLIVPLEDAQYWASVDSKKPMQLTQQQRMKQWNWGNEEKRVSGITSAEGSEMGLSFQNDPNIKQSGQYHVRFKGKR